MYKEYKIKLASKEYKKWNNYSLDLNPQIAEKLKKFIPTKE